MIPVTVIGGFLGAGKTTLVNHLLRTATRRYAVLVNDFGALNVDAALISGQDGAVMALANGCVCCSVGPDLGDTLARIARRDPAPEHILVEASGVSDPWRVAQLVKLEEGVALDGVLVLVDAEAFPGQLADPYLADTLERQLARADIAVLNKTDLAAPGEAAALLRRIRPGLRTVEVAHAALPEALVGGSAGPGSRFAAEPAHHPFRTWLWRGEAVFDRGRLAALLDALPPPVLRLKGMCRVGPDGAPHLLQMVGRRWSLTPAPLGEAGLVMIGTAALPAAGALDALFKAALAPGQGASLDGIDGASSGANCTDRGSPARNAGSRGLPSEGSPPGCAPRPGLRVVPSGAG